jgi:hypothetical protein
MASSPSHAQFEESPIGQSVEWQAPIRLNDVSFNDPKKADGPDLLLLRGWR